MAEKAPRKIHPRISHRAKELRTLYDETETRAAEEEAFIKNLTERGVAVHRKKYDVLHQDDPTEWHTRRSALERDSWEMRNDLQRLLPGAIDQIARQKSLSDNWLRVSKEHFDKHAEAYHDIAVEEATRDRKTINIEQRVSPAEQIEVHKD